MTWPGVWLHGSTSPFGFTTTSVRPAPHGAWFPPRVARFRAAGIDSPLADARILLSHALSVDRLALLTDPHEPVTEIVRRRSACEKSPNSDEFGYGIRSPF